MPIHISRKLTIPLYAAAILVCATVNHAVAQHIPLPPPTSNVITNVSPVPEKKLLDLLIWDALMKEAKPAAGDKTADFVFKVSNPSDDVVTISEVHTSCGCTVAKLPSTPWPLQPHTNGQIDVTVNLAGKSGTFFKTITVRSTNAQKILTIKVTLPENPAMARMRNQQIAMGDAQAIFRGDCAKCHVEPARGKMGKQLYVEACGICHEARPRATMVSDLRNLKHPTDYAFWKQIITFGKPHSMMPAFSDKHGGPLNDAQIESLAKVLADAFPSHAVVIPAQSSTFQPTVINANAQQHSGIPLPPALRRTTN